MIRKFFLLSVFMILLNTPARAGDVLLLQAQGIWVPEAQPILDNFINNVFAAEFAANGGSALNATQQADFDAHNTSTLIGCFANNLGQTSCTPSGTLTSGCNPMDGGNCS